MRYKDIGSMADDSKMLVKFQIERLDNNTFLATLVTQANSSGLHGAGGAGYDGEGALYYVVAVVFIYGFSIIGFMIGSLIKRNKSDNGVSKYMKDMDKVRRMERRQQKFNTRLAMSAAGGSRRASRALAARGCNMGGAELAGPFSAPPATLTNQTFTWDCSNKGANAGGGGLQQTWSESALPSDAWGSATLSGTTGGAWSARGPLLSCPPAGRAVHVSSPRHTTGTTQEALPPHKLCHPDLTVADTGVDVRVGVGGGDGEASCSSTVIFVENENNSKCKVSLVQAQLGTVHEVDEEHVTCGADVIPAHDVTTCSDGAEYPVVNV